MTESQRRALEAMPGTVGQIAWRIGKSPAVTQRVLDALYRRSWATITPQGRWCTLERGRNKAA